MKDRIISFVRENNYFPKVLVTSIVFYYYKTAFWPLTYFFVVSYAIMILLFIIRFDWKFRFPFFFSNYKAPLILAGIFILAFLLDGNFTNVIIKKEILLILVLFSIFFFLHWSTYTMKWEFPVSYAFNLTIFITIFISVLNVIFAIFPSVISSELLSSFNLIDGTVLAKDYNFFCLFILLGLVLINSGINKKSLGIGYKKIVIVSVSFIFLLNVLLSGSRRGIFVLVVLLFIYTIIKIVKIIRDWRKFRIKSIIIGGLILFSTIIFFFILGTNIIQRIPKQKITETVIRYTSIIGISDYNELYKILWDPKNKISRLTGSYYNTSSKDINPQFLKYSRNRAKLSSIETPFGTGIKIIRKSRINNDNYVYYDGPAIIYLANHSYEISFKTKLLSGDLRTIKIGWFLDENGRGYSNVESQENEIESLGNDWYSFSSRYTFIDNQIGIAFYICPIENQSEFIISEIKISDQDFNTNLPGFPDNINNKDEIVEWLDKINPPLLNDSNLINNGNFSYGLGFWRYNADSVKINIESNNGVNYAIIERGDGNNGFWSLYYSGRNIEFKEKNDYQIAFKMKPIHPKTIPFNVGFDIDEGAGTLYRLNLDIDTLINGWLDIKARYTFLHDQKHLVFPINSQIDSSKFYITDISLVNMTQPQYQEKQIYGSDIIKKNDSRFSDRTSRWLYAIDLWKTEYNWNNKIFGHGFDYLNWYGMKFNYNIPDWPHNPFISILLYSGIVGLIFYLWLLFKVIKLYIKYRTYYGIAFIGFLMTFFFTFFSGNNPFDPPIMGFFIMLPFFIHSIHKRDDEQKNMKNMTDENTDNRQP